MRNDVMNPPIPIPIPRVRDRKPLILRQLGIAMIILAVGLFIALTVFIGELCMKRRTKQKQQSELSERNVVWQ